MSQQNVDVAKRAIAAFNARDVECFASLTTMDFTWFPSMAAIEGPPFEGGPGIERYFANLGNAWESFQIVPGEFRTLPDIVVMLGRLRGQGKGSGVPVDSEVGMVFDFRDGAISRIRGFLEHADTLTAVGVED